MSQDKIIEVLKTQNEINKKLSRLISDMYTIPPMEKQSLNNLFSEFENKLKGL